MKHALVGIESCLWSRTKPSGFLRIIDYLLCGQAPPEAQHGPSQHRTSYEREGEHNER